MAWPGLVIAAGYVAGCGDAPAPEAPVAVRAPVEVARCVLTFRDHRRTRVARVRLERDLAQYLRGRPGRVIYGARDLATKVRLGRGEHDQDVITAGGAKVDILAALLAARDSRLAGEERGLATRMILERDNLAADTLWSLLGGETSLSGFYAGLGLSESTPGPGIFWGGTTTSPADRIRLLRTLVKGGGGLTAADRGMVLGLMGRMGQEQSWGVSAAARPGDRVALKNGWTPQPQAQVSWAVTSYGRVEGPGRDLLLSVQTDGQPSQATAIETVEEVARMIGARLGELSPRTTRPCPTNPIA